MQSIGYQKTLFLFFICCCCFRMSEQTHSGEKRPCQTCNRFVLNLFWMNTAVFSHKRKAVFILFTTLLSVYLYYLSYLLYYSILYFICVNDNIPRSTDIFSRTTFKILQVNAPNVTLSSSPRHLPRNRLQRISLRSSQSDSCPIISDTVGGDDVGT